MLRAGVPLVVAFCGGALSGCGGDQPTTAAPTPAPTPTTVAPAPAPTPAPTSLQLAWKNHFDGFGAGVGSKSGTPDRVAAVEMIMKEYDAKSIVSIWDASKTDAENCKDGVTDGCTPAEEYTGPTRIAGMFEVLFDNLQGCVEKDIKDGLNASFDLTEPTTSAPGSVFLVWQCEKAGYFMATDTFIFEGVMIKKQNIVVQSKKVEAYSQGSWQPNSLSQRLLPQADWKPTKVADAWKNHFDAFALGADGKPDGDKTKALDDIMKDYTADSVVHLAEVAEGTTAIPAFDVHKGLDDIRKMFDGLFKEIPDVCNLAPPLVEVTGDAEPAGSEAKQVFLVWRIPASGYEYATDTFIFDNNFRIIKQNIVAVRAAKDRADCTDASVVV